MYTDYGRIYNDVITNIATNTTPNVCITYPDHIATYMTGTNSVVALDELFSNEKYGLGGSELLFASPTQEEIVPQFLQECMISGQHYALPYMRSTEACYVNKTTGDYQWATKTPGEGYEIDSSITSESTCVPPELPACYKDASNNYVWGLHHNDNNYTLNKDCYI